MSLLRPLLSLKPNRTYTITLSTTVDSVGEGMAVAYAVPTLREQTVIITPPGATASGQVMSGETGTCVTIDIMPGRGLGTVSWSIAEGGRVLLALDLGERRSYYLGVGE